MSRMLSYSRIGRVTDIVGARGYLRGASDVRLVSIDMHLSHQCVSQHVVLVPKWSYHTHVIVVWPLDMPCIK